MIGAVVGAALYFKDEVEDKKANGTPMNVLMNLVFGRGLVSLIFVWIPLILCFSIALIAMTL